MEGITELATPGGCTDVKDLQILTAPLETFLENQKELKMIDSDILAVVSDDEGDMVKSKVSGGANTAGSLTFLNKTECKEEDDSVLSFLLADGKMEVNGDDLNFLEEQDLSDAYSCSEDENESYSDEESVDEVDEENEDMKNDSKEEIEKEGNEAVDDGVFGQVSFYDDSESINSLDAEKAKKIKFEETGKQKRLKQKRKTENDSESLPARKKHRAKRKRTNSDKNHIDDKVPKSGSSLMRRKNIRSILKEKDLDKEMLSAQNEELERQKRLMELKKFLLTDTTTAATVITSSTAAEKTASVLPGSCVTREDSQLKSLLQVAEIEAVRETENKERQLLDKESVKVKQELNKTLSPSDVITLSSDSENSDDDDESDDVVMVPSDEDEDEQNSEDVNNGGTHINDTLNLPDLDGRVQVNIGHPLEDPDIYLAPQIAQAIKPHQIGGVRFLYDNLIESLQRFQTTPGFGCILAHSMGLGKTIQLISFIDIFIRCAGGKRVLCIVPINTLQNWLAEFNYWLPPVEKLHPNDKLTQARSFPLFVINDSMKTTPARAAVIEKWRDHGGVLVLGYEMFRLLSSNRVAPSRTKSRSKKPLKPEIIDVEEEDKNNSLMIDMYSMLVDPGPDLVMCDEGHRIKNSGTAISKALKSIKTRRRVVLTGYPLQNNLMEYWCMVDFVRPNFLGTKAEFSNMFERPIMNGQCMDSTTSDKKIMRHRSYVLHNLLEGFVQRRGHTVLQLSLPPKTEHVFMVRMSQIQRKIYCEFMNTIAESGLRSWANNNPLKAFSVCCKIWNHLDILHEVLTKHIADKDNDLDIDTGDRSNSKKKTASFISHASNNSTPTLTPSASASSLASMSSEGGLDKNLITYDWAEPLLKNYVAGMLENSGKFTLMFSLIEECLSVGDKVLIFSQSLLTLNKIEQFLNKFKIPRSEMNENWQRNKTYFRLDGSTSAQDREKLINQFNDPESNVWLFLLSTKAGCLGINLIAANRVIVLDASWNPCHDCQAICRVYRFGQIKNSYIYRLITDNTLEKRIYDRQVNKQGMSDRIVDDMNPENKLTRRQVENLLDYEDQEFPVLDFTNAASKYGQDSVMLNVLKKHGYWLTKQPFTHESLLIDHKELRLSKREKQFAKEVYARDKWKSNMYSRPLYAPYYPPQYPQIGGLPNQLPSSNKYSYQAFRSGPVVPPIASARPMIASNFEKTNEKFEFGSQSLRPGVSIHQVITTTDIQLPGTSSCTQAGVSANKIAAGQKILVIKTPKGVYIRTHDGKMFAVKSKSAANFGNIVGTSTVTTKATTTPMTSVGASQAFATNTAAPLVNKSPIVNLSKKSGTPFPLMNHNIAKNLPYDSSNSLSSLKSSIGTRKTSDSTTLSSLINASRYTSPSPWSLTSLVSSNDMNSAESDVNVDEQQVTVNRKVPGMFPSLATCTPQLLSNISSSTQLKSSPSDSAVFMATKPVLAEQTPRSPNQSFDDINDNEVETHKSLLETKNQRNTLLADSVDPAMNLISAITNRSVHSSAMSPYSRKSLYQFTSAKSSAQTSPSTEITEASFQKQQQLDQSVQSFQKFDNIFENNFESEPSPKASSSSLSNTVVGNKSSIFGREYNSVLTAEDTNSCLSLAKISDGNNVSNHVFSLIHKQFGRSDGNRHNITSPYTSSSLGSYRTDTQGSVQNIASYMLNKHQRLSAPVSEPSDQSSHSLSGHNRNQSQNSGKTHTKILHNYHSLSDSPNFSSFETKKLKNVLTNSNTSISSSFQDAASSSPFQYSSNIGDFNIESSTASPTPYISHSQGDPELDIFYSAENLNSLHMLEQPNTNGFIHQNQHSSSSSTLKERHMNLFKDIPSMAPSLRYSSHNSDESLMDVPKKAHTHRDPPELESGSYDVFDINSSFKHVYSDSPETLHDNNSGCSAFSSSLNHKVIKDRGMGGPGSTSQIKSTRNMPYRLEKEEMASGANFSQLNYSSERSVLSHVDVLENSGDEYRSGDSVGTSSTSYSAGSQTYSIPVTSHKTFDYPMMPSSMTEAPAPPAIDKSVWPLIPSDLINRDLSYSTNSSNMTLSSDIHHEDFSHLNTNSMDNFL